MTSVLSLVVAVVLKGCTLLALVGGGLLAGALVLAAGVGVVLLALALGLLAGAAGLAVGVALLLSVLAILLCPLLLPALLVYLLVRPRRSGAASNGAATPPSASHC